MFKKNNFGSTIHNVRIDLILDPVTFSGRTPHETEISDLIETGNVCGFAKKFLDGPRHVTEKGYLLKETHEHDKHPFYEATLNINENWHELHVLMRNIANNETTPYNAPVIRYGDGSVQYIKNEGSMLYLPLVRECIGLEKSKRVA